MMIAGLGVLAGVAVAVFIVAAATVRFKWEKSAAVDRSILRVLGVAFAFTRYDPDRFLTTRQGSGLPESAWTPENLARPFSGAALGIAWSFWIYTRGHALGWARVRDWALPAYLQIIVADIAVTTESGECVIKPAKRYLPGEHVRVGVVNRNPCRAVGEVTADVLIECGMMGDRTTYGRTFNVEPSESRYVELDIVAPGEGVVIERIHYSTKPTGDARTGRLHGRPEWEA